MISVSVKLIWFISVKFELQLTDVSLQSTDIFNENFTKDGPTSENAHLARHSRICKKIYKDTDPDEPHYLVHRVQ